MVERHQVCCAAQKAAVQSTPRKCVCVSEYVCTYVGNNETESVSESESKPVLVIIEFSQELLGV